MRYLKTAVACAMAGAAFAMPAAWAETIYANGPSGAHYAQGKAEPMCTGTTSISCTDSVIGGIGNTNATLRLAVTFSATVTCTNRGGTTVAVKTQVPTTNSQTLRPSAKNGQIVVPAVESAPPNTADFEANTTCPNPNWRKTLVDGSVGTDGFLYTLTFAGFTGPFIELP